MPYTHGSQELHIALSNEEQAELVRALLEMEQEGRITIIIAYQEDEKPLVKFQVEEYTAQDEFTIRLML